MVAASARATFQRHLRAVPTFVDYWGKKAKEVREMVKIKRDFLTQIFEREKRTMFRFFQGKKKFKKNLTKL